MSTIENRLRTLFQTVAKYCSLFSQDIVMISLKAVPQMLPLSLIGEYIIYLKL